MGYGLRQSLQLYQDSCYEQDDRFHQLGLLKRCTQLRLTSYEYGDQNIGESYSVLFALSCFDILIFYDFNYSVC